VIRGEAPGVSAWRVNAGGLVRSEDEIAQVLANAGIRVPKDVRFFVGEADEFYGTIDDIFAGRSALTARLGSLTEDARGFVYFNNQRNRFGQIPIRLSPAMMHSDEAIAAVALVHLRDWWLTIRPTTNQLQFVDQAENCTPTD
jgi:hypothetical protein